MIVRDSKNEKGLHDFVSGNPIKKMMAIRDVVNKDFNSLEVNPSEYLIHAKEMDQDEIPQRVFYANTSKFIGLILITDKSTIYSGSVKKGLEIFTETGKQIDRVVLKVLHVNMFDISAYKLNQSSQYVEVDMTFHNEDEELEVMSFTTPVFGVKYWIDYIFSQQEILTSDS